MTASPREEGDKFFLHHAKEALPNPVMPGDCEEDFKKNAKPDSR